MLCSLANLRSTRVALGLGRQHLATLADMTPERLRKLELREDEPWFSEALTLAFALRTDGINPLLSSGDLTLAECGGDTTPFDLELWRSGRRTPLSLAIRIALRFGLSDPAQLHTTSLHRQIWDMLESGDRSAAAPGLCPWCGVDRHADASGERAPHLPTCLPNNLWAPNDVPTTIAPLKPMTKAHENKRKGKYAFGLRALRVANGWRQQDVATMLAVNPNHYARVERGELYLPLPHARLLAAQYGVTVEAVYAEPEPEAVEASKGVRIFKKERQVT